MASTIIATAEGATTTPKTTTAYEELLKELDAVAQLSRVSSVLEYDKVRSIYINYTVLY